MITKLEQVEKSLTNSYRNNMLVLEKVSKFCSEIVSSGLLLEYTNAGGYIYQALQPIKKPSGTYKFYWRAYFTNLIDDRFISVIVRQTTVEYKYGMVCGASIFCTEKTKDIIIPSEVQTFIDLHKNDLKPAYRL